MALVTGTGSWTNKNTHRQVWTPLLNGDNGSAHSGARLPDKTFSVHGTFGVGGSIQCEGSEDGSTWFICKDINGNDIVLTAAGARSLGVNPTFTRPRVTAGDGSTSLTATMMSSADT